MFEYFDSDKRQAVAERIDYGFYKSIATDA